MFNTIREILYHAVVASLCVSLMGTKYTLENIGSLLDFSKAFDTVNDIYFSAKFISMLSRA